MNWSQELIDSLLWIAKSFAIISVLFSLTVFVLSKKTQWGKQFWALTHTYFNPQHRKQPLILFSIIVLFNLLSVRIDILISNWYNAIYDALQNMNESTFWQQMMLFGVIATVNVINVLVTYYVSQRFTIHWRTWLNEQMLNKWMHNQAYYKAQYSQHQLDNPDQRIQQDVSAFVSNSLSFATGLISSIVSIFAFTIILWDLSGPMTIGGIEIPHMMVFLVFIYVLFSSVIAFKIGRPLITLNFENEKRNANYRYSLMRLKEYAESIAFYRGEKMEKNLLTRQFQSVIENLWQMVYRTLKLSGFNLTISQISVVFPLLIQASRYFSSQITLGALMQTSSAFGQVQSSLSFFRNAYDSFTEYRAILSRLSGFQQVLESAEKQTALDIQDHSDQVRLKNLTIYTPEGNTLVKDLNLTLNRGDSLLIQGQSGAGKTTLLRTIAGLWRFAEGQIAYPQHNKLFLSQKPYIPQGQLIDALYYPMVTPAQLDVDHVKSVLNQVHLTHLVDKLEETQDWIRVLSLGEQQRLAFARLLLHKPVVAFLDEATASLDEGLEDAMYRLIKQHLPETILISIGHRSTLLAHHQQHLRIGENT